MRVRLDYLGGKRFKVYSRQHSFYVDLPAAKGGSDSAPGAIDYFLGALGSSIAVYGLKHCQEVGIPCENMRLTLNAELDEGSTCVKKIDCTVSSFSTPLKDKKDALVDAMKKCIISQTVETKPEIAINIEEPPEEASAAGGQQESEEEDAAAEGSGDKAPSDSAMAAPDTSEQEASQSEQGSGADDSSA